MRLALDLETYLEKFSKILYWKEVLKANEVGHFRREKN
jgi:hypothetical protein